VLFGEARSVEDPGVFHRVSLVAFLAWVGLGADGLSSSAYGPEESFKALGQHTYLAAGLALATAFTVLIISYAYSRIIEHFPYGGGGYVVATRLLGRSAGVVSGSALLIDYVLTITTSIASGADAIYSFLPPEWATTKLACEFFVIGLLVVLNLRGIRESVTVLTPIFLLFLVTHAILLLGVGVTHSTTIKPTVQHLHADFTRGFATLGVMGMLALFMRAYSMGAGTYTGIEAVSNGLMIMREPKVETGKRTMVLLATSLAVTAGGITLAYLLFNTHPDPARTMNAVLIDQFAGGFHVGGLPLGRWYFWATLVSEALLLFVAAQTGFIDGPRVMANMATDSWLPHRFAQLSDRLTMQNGVLLMGLASVAALSYTHGDVTRLVIMYSINVFLTFSLSQLAMCRYWFRERKKHADWRKHIFIHVVGLVLCATILFVNIYEKFAEGAWLTLVVTSALIFLCILIRNHYRNVQKNLKRLDEILPSVESSPGKKPPPLEPRQPTAVLMVGAYAGLGVHSLLSIQRLFPNHFKNFIFLSVGVIDSATFKDSELVDEVKQRTRESLEKYVALAQGLGLAADFRYSVATEAVAEAERLCSQVGKEFPRSIFFAGKLVFEHEHWYQKVLHNETAYQIQRRLQFAGLNAMVLPVRVLQPS
jgi:amino acid transporter